MTAPARNAPIDALRGTAIVLVMLLHFSLTYRLGDSPLSALFGRDGVRALVNNGNYGVTVFFAISGFVISAGVLQRQHALAAIDWRLFYARRAARILPGLLLALVIIVVLGCAGVPSFTNHDNGRQLPASFFVVAIGSVLSFTHNLLMQSTGYFNYCLNVYWSLSVEEMFYLVCPALCLLARRDVAIVTACLALVVVAPFYRSLHADDELFFMVGNLACFDAIAMGCLAALAAARRQLRHKMAGWCAAAALACLTAAYLQGIAGHEVFGFSWVAGATSVFLVCAGAGAGNSVARFPLFAPLRWAGRHSDELYLFHIIVLALMRDAVPRQALPFDLKLAWLAMFFGLSALAAGLVARCYGKPLETALRDRLFAMLRPARPQPV